MRYIYADISLLYAVSHGIDIFCTYAIISNVESENPNSVLYCSSKMKIKIHQYIHIFLGPIHLNNTKKNWDKRKDAFEMIFNNFYILLARRKDGRSCLH